MRDLKVEAYYKKLVSVASKYCGKEFYISKVLRTGYLTVVGNLYIDIAHVRSVRK